MPEFNNWKDAWDYHAHESFLEYMEMSEDELLKKIVNWEYDLYYTIWMVIWQKWTIEKSAPVLIKLLENLNDEQLFLERYHITENLFKIMKIEDDDLKWSIVWKNDWVDLKKKSKALEKIKWQLIWEITWI